MSVVTHKQSYMGFSGIGYFGDIAFDVEKMRRFDEDAVIFFCKNDGNAPLIVAARGKTHRFCPGERFDISLLTEEIPAFEFEDLPDVKCSVCAALFPCGDEAVSYASANELASLFDPRHSGALFSAGEREAVYGIKNAASFFGCGVDYVGSESARISFVSTDPALNVMLLMLCALFRRFSRRRGFNLRIESVGKTPCLAFSAALYCENDISSLTKEFESSVEFLFLKELFYARSLPLLYRFAELDGEPRLILRFAPVSVSVETLLRAALPESLAGYDDLSEEEKIPDVLGEY